MKTIVVKGDMYSFRNITNMEDAETKEINLVLVYPMGNTKTIQTSKELFIEETEDMSSIIYGKEEVGE